ncbi:MAG: hypothetical protein JW753_09825 [Dehalococcoidia bacterium]|nr:hypothetical protein [Dehalococcoidia bacterium]
MKKRRSPKTLCTALSIAGSLPIRMDGWEYGSRRSWRDARLDDSLIRKK